MKKYIQFFVLGFSLLGAFFISIFGADGISSLIHLTPQDIYIRSVLFLVGTFFFESLLERATTFNQIDNIEEGFKKNVFPFFARFQNNQKQRRFYELLWKYLFRGRTTMPSEGGKSFIVQKGHIIHLWRDCISESKSWKALSYSNNLWLNDEAELSKLEQDLFIKTGGKLSRIYIFDELEEVTKFQEKEINKAIIAEGDSRWILKKKLLSAIDGHSQHLFKKYDLIDFAISNENNYVLWFHIHEKSKSLDTAELTIDADVIDAAINIYAIAHSEGNRF